MATTFTPMSRSSAPLGEAPGRPGVNALRTAKYVLVTRATFQALRQLRDALPKGSVPPNPNLKVNELGFSRCGMREMLRIICHGKQNSDFLIAALHAHEPGNWSELPADFVPILAHAAIDAGADVFVVHGPNQFCSASDAFSVKIIHLTRLTGPQSARAAQQVPQYRRPTRVT